MRLTVKLLVIVVFCGVIASAQTPAPAPSDAQQFSKGDLSFNYPKGWTLTDMSDDDAQQYSFANSAADIQMRVFAHKGRIGAEKLPEAKKAFIDPYVASIEKQFVAMGATPQKSPDTSEIGGVKADGVQLTASLGGEPGAAKIYWALVGQRVVVMTLFGPDRDIKKFATAWDTLRTTIKIAEPAPAASPSIKPSP
ncbi:MAG TPA: hypothetical protein VFD62_14265 [Pyrinomonadaceae bacterium]|nr:hypothetical protein [Pyrinomonadaceae bacterium]